MEPNQAIATHALSLFMMQKRMHYQFVRFDTNSPKW